MEIQSMQCWKCGSSQVTIQKVRVGKLRTTPEQLAQKVKDNNIYQEFYVCKECEYKFQPYQDDYRKKIIYNRSRNDKFINLAVRLIQARQPCVIYVGLTEHADAIHLLLQSVMKNTGLDTAQVALIHGKLDSDDNEENRQKFIRGDITCAICTSIWGEGTDVPNLRWMLYMKAGLAGLELTQIIGRILRTCKGKFRAAFVDSQDLHDKKYASRARGRQKHLKKEGYDITILAESAPRNCRRRYLQKKP